MLARRVFGRSAFATALVVLISTSRPVTAEPLTQEMINQSIERGVKFLKKEQKAAGYWGTGNTPKEANGIGYTALVGLVLIECGGPDANKEPAVKRAARIVRDAANDLDSTYELALAILFLDRMKEKTDKKVIQLLAGRLISAQMPSGGWGYKTQKYSDAEIAQLLTALRKLSPADDAKNPPDKLPDPLKLRAALPGNLKRVAVLGDLTPGGRLPGDPKEKRQDLFDATTDNSNTHFAMIGLWAARKYDIPVDRTFNLVSQRFRTSQGGSGTWAYDFARTGADGGNQFTCIALLGVAIGHVVSPDPNFKPEVDPVVIKAFVSLNRAVGAPAGDINNRPKVKDIGGLYFLWAMERIAVLYDIQQFGKKDWYIWGAEILVWNQAGNGSWDEDGGYPGQSPIINTCMALLFLKRANLTPDLSKRLSVNPGVLAAKVDDTITPKPPEPTPPVSAPVIETAPMPHEVVTKPTPVSTPAPPPPPADEPAPAPKKSNLLLIILGVVLAGSVGGFLAFFLVRRKKDDEEEDDDDDEDDKKKKKGKKKVKTVAATNGKADAKTKPKVKTDVEVDEDDD